MRLPLSRSAALRLLGGAAAVALPRPAFAQARPLRIGTVAADSYAEPYYALDAGIFARHGITAEVTTFPNGAAVASACAGGAVDAGVTDIVPIANAVARGVPFAIVAACGLYTTEDPVTYLVAAKSASFKAPKDFEGRSIAVVSLISLSSVAVREWLAKGGADLTKVKFVEMPFATMAPALGRGAIDAAFLSEPFLTDAGGTVRIVAKSYDALAARFAISDWFTTKGWLEANRPLATRLVAAIYDTARWANDHHDQSAAILAKYSKLPIAKIRSMRRAPYATSLSPGLLQPVLDAAAKYKALAQPMSADTLIANV